MGDENFVKLLVCFHNKWNPYSDEVKKIPLHYWLINFYMLRTQPILNWKEGFEPQAELIGQLTHPEIYKEYIAFKDKIKEKKEKGEPIDVSVKTEKGVTAYSITENKYDPDKGLVDANGNVIIPKEKFAKMMHFEEGVPVSF